MLKRFIAKALAKSMGLASIDDYLRHNVLLFLNFHGIIHPEYVVYRVDRCKYKPHLYEPTVIGKGYRNSELVGFAIKYSENIGVIDGCILPPENTNSHGLVAKSYQKNDCKWNCLYSFLRNELGGYLDLDLPSSEASLTGAPTLQAEPDQAEEKRSTSEVTAFIQKRLFETRQAVFQAYGLELGSLHAGICLDESSIKPLIIRFYFALSAAIYSVEMSAKSELREISSGDFFEPFDAGFIKLGPTRLCDILFDTSPVPSFAFELDEFHYLSGELSTTEAMNGGQAIRLLRDTFLTPFVDWIAKNIDIGAGLMVRSLVTGIAISELEFDVIDMFVEDIIASFFDDDGSFESSLRLLE